MALGKGIYGVRRGSTLIRLALPFLLVGGVIAGTAAGAQENTNGKSAPGSTAEKMVSVDAENATLARVIATLMQNIGANYALDNSLRAIRVTAHLHNVRLDIALNILLRNANPPITYRYENDIYSFISKVEPTTPEPAGTDTQGQPLLGGLKHIQVARVNFIDAAFAAQILGGISIRTPEGQTYGLVDPQKLNAAVTAPGTGGANSSGNAGAAGAAQPGSGNTTTGGNQNSAFPPNLFDYLWIVNAGAYR